LIAAVQAGLRWSTGLLRTREQLLALAVCSLSGVCLDSSIFRVVDLKPSMQ
jgi:hypothetical protein